MEKYEFVGFDLTVCGRGEALIITDLRKARVVTVAGSAALALLDAIAEAGVVVAVGAYLDAIAA